MQFLYLFTSKNTKVQIEKLIILIMKVQVLFDQLQLNDRTQRLSKTKRGWVTCDVVLHSPPWRVAILLVASCYGNRHKLSPDDPSIVCLNNLVSRDHHRHHWSFSLYVTHKTSTGAGAAVSSSVFEWGPRRTTGTVEALWILRCINKIGVFFVTLLNLNSLIKRG